jgi:hypothetical protein
MTRQSYPWRDGSNAIRVVRLRNSHGEQHNLHHRGSGGRAGHTCILWLPVTSIEDSATPFGSLSVTCCGAYPPSALYPAGSIEPCLPTVRSKPPSGMEWIHQVKHDGYRLMIRREGRRGANRFVRQLLRVFSTHLGPASAITWSPFLSTSRTQGYCCCAHRNAARAVSMLSQAAIIRLEVVPSGSDFSIRKGSSCDGISTES